MREGFYVGFSVYFYLIDRIFVNLDFKPGIYGGANFFAGVYFCGLAIFGVLQELIFAIFRKYPVPSIVLFSFLLSTSNRKTYFQALLSQYFVVSE